MLLLTSESVWTFCRGTKPMVTDSKHKKAAVAAVVGNVMEWYDFAVYAYVSRPA